jgi:protection-of-telomeres protein 1
VRCSYPAQPIVGLSEILRPEKLAQGGNDEVLLSPFALRKYRANVRVVDFFPHRIEDFAVRHRTSEFDILSDHSDEEDTDEYDEQSFSKRGRVATKTIWEWRFALQVEDAMANDTSDRLWLLVDNLEAQCLLGLEDNALE